MREQGSQ